MKTFFKIFIFSLIAIKCYSQGDSALYHNSKILEDEVAPPIFKTSNNFQSFVKKNFSFDFSDINYLSIDLKIDELGYPKNVKIITDDLKESKKRQIIDFIVNKCRWFPAYKNDKGRKKYIEVSKSFLFKTLKY